MNNYRIIAFDPYEYQKTYFVEAESYAEAEKMVNRMRNNEMRERYEVGEYIIYQNGEKYEIGRITKLQNDGAFVCYHEGETAAKISYDVMHKLANAYTIEDTSIGGERFHPSGCSHCEWLFVNTNSDESYCNMNDGEQVFYQRGKRMPDWCPLKKGR